jgi:L-arabinokinase
LDVHDRSPRQRQQRGQPSVHADGSHQGPSEATGAAIAFYVSGHGFGHASRQVEIINAVATRLPGVRIVLRTSAARWLLERTLNAPFTLDDRPCDTGVVQIDSLRLDEAATMAAAADFYSSFDERIAIEARLLREHGVWLVISDAPPLACAAAAAAGIPCIVVANFTWDWIYATYASTSSDPAPMQNRHTSGSELVRRLADAYALAEAAWRLPLHGGFESFATIVDVPFVARHARYDASETRARLALPSRRRLALSSFGGYGLDRLELHRLDCLDTWRVIVTGDRTPSDLPSNVIFIEDAAIYGRGLRYEDLVRAVDVVATKPGYGIVSECIANETAIAYTTRGRFREYDALVAGIRRYLRSAFIDQSALRAGRWRAALDAAVAAPRPLERPPTDGAEAVADMIAARLGSSAPPGSSA